MYFVDGTEYVLVYGFVNSSNWNVVVDIMFFVYEGMWGMVMKIELKVWCSDNWSGSIVFG